MIDFIFKAVHTTVFIVYYVVLIYWTQENKVNACNVFSLQSIPFMHVKFYAGIECLQKSYFDACDKFMKKDLKTSFFSFVSSWKYWEKKRHAQKVSLHEVYKKLIFQSVMNYQEKFFVIMAVLLKSFAYGGV